MISASIKTAALPVIKVQLHITVQAQRDTGLRYEIDHH